MKTCKNPQFGQSVHGCSWIYYHLLYSIIYIYIYIWFYDVIISHFFYVWKSVGATCRTQLGIPPLSHQGGSFQGDPTAQEDVDPACWKSLPTKSPAVLKKVSHQKKFRWKPTRYRTLDAPRTCQPCKQTRLTKGGGWCVWLNHLVTSQNSVPFQRKHKRWFKNRHKPP